jgi:hypothetical protein
MAAPGASVVFQAALSQHLGKPGHPSLPRHARLKALGL